MRYLIPFMALLALGCASERITAPPLQRHEDKPEPGRPAGVQSDIDGFFSDGQSWLLSKEGAPREATIHLLSGDGVHFDRFHGKKNLGAVNGNASMIGLYDPALPGFRVQLEVDDDGRKEYASRALRAR